MLYLSRMDLRRQRSMRLSMCYLMVMFHLLVRVLMLFECWNSQNNLTLYSDVKSDRICIHWIQRKSLWVVSWMPAIMEVDCRRASILLQHFRWQWPKNPRILIWKICLLCGFDDCSDSHNQQFLAHTAFILVSTVPSFRTIFSFCLHWPNL